MQAGPGGRPSCQRYMAYKNTCTGTVSLKRRKIHKYQRWVIEQQPGSGAYRIRPSACPGTALSFALRCNVTSAMLYPEAQGFNDWALLPLGAVPPPKVSNVSVAATKTQDWGSGYTGQISLVNNNPYPIYDW